MPAIDYLEPDTSEDEEAQEEFDFKELDRVLGKPSVDEVRSLLLYSAVRELMEPLHPSMSEIYQCFDDLHRLGGYSDV